MSAVRIIPYRDELRPSFERLNREWIEAHFAIEPHDLRFFGDPRREIIDRGGAIFFAELATDIATEIVGTAALTHADGLYELAKLAVTKRAQGHGVGEKLSRAVIEAARARGATSLQLTTNRKLEAAIRLYERLGFKTIATGPHPVYRRIDLVMELKL